MMITAITKFSNFQIFKSVFPVTWNIRTNEKILFLTFDDGPIPEVTPWVLDALQKYHAKATFFCIGENVSKYPDVYSQIAEQGHAIGNHTYNHLNGWKIKTKSYLDNIGLCENVLKLETRNLELETRKLLFRPPYGKISPSQISSLKSKYSIILWDVLSKDWKENLTGDQCFERIRRKSKPGSIIVFHDSLKAEKRMKPALLSTLDYFSGQGYSFEGL